jgi:hypothetical protein
MRPIRLPLKPLESEEPTFPNHHAVRHLVFYLKIIYILTSCFAASNESSMFL